MSFVIRRGVSTLVPPKIANPSGLGAAKDAVRMARIAKFYERLPKGSAPEFKSSGPLGWYRDRYFGKDPSAAPIWHLIFSLVGLGYGMEYYYHLRHHKNNAAEIDEGSLPLAALRTMSNEVVRPLSKSWPPSSPDYTNTVMAESSSQDAALKSSSAGVTSPSEITATTTDSYAIEGDAEEVAENQENGVASQKEPFKTDEQQAEDGSARSDTDTQDVKPAKKFTTSKPVSFAKYSLPKTLTTNTPPKLVSDKVVSATPVPTSAQTLGRPRLVAKATSSLQQKPIAYKPVTPDPNQVWNKNRVTPQPSTKHLTDEELKQQYGIHLTTRLQSDGEGKEAKWADIDDDEDDWAPETIEWNDGTKTTVNPAEALAAKANGATKSPVSDTTKTLSTAPKIVAPQYPSSIGPNAIVLKVGANVERQQAQKAAQQARGPSDKSPLLSSKTATAPAPVKSPWAKLPEIEKVSPIAINPQPPVSQPPVRYPSVVSQTSNQNGPVASPAKEISADDFNRQWRNSPTSSTRELFMPSSGRYEAVSDGRRRMSRNEPNFRAPAVLQRPNHSENRAPAEPSAAFQTNRTSVDQGRRRASSSISGTSGQFARRMSFKSSDVPLPPSDSSRVPQLETNDARSVSQDGPPSQIQTPTYQVRGGDYLSSGSPVGPEGDIEAQRTAQKALMKENIERARKRKVEEEQRMEAEKQERIRAKLAALGPDPKLQAKAEETSKEKETAESTQSSVQQPVTVQSPPKPPQPLATGEPQQYGMMKVHPMDSIKKISPPTAQPLEPAKSLGDIQNTTVQVQQPVLEKTPPSLTNSARSSSDSQRPLIDSAANPEPSPKFNKPVVSMNSDARAGWGNSRNEHRVPQASNLWGLPHNKALGNGTFDQSLAGYSPQDLSRTSSTGQGWMNGRTPTIGQSPQLHHATHQMPETRSHLLQSMTSPGQQPLTLNSEADSVLPINRPAPIGPPQSQSLPPTTNGVAAWNNFHNVARTQERTENERFNREYNERRDEELRTGVRQQLPYNLTETFKQVQLGEQVGQRHVSNIAQTALPPSGPFRAVGSMPPSEYPSRMVNGQAGRGSRFFPQQTNGISHERRAMSESHSGIPRMSSPPPAEEIASYHPAFDGSHQRPVVHFPREKAVVRLPPTAPPAPPSPVREAHPPSLPAPMTWAARVQMAPPPPPPPPQRAVSQPIAWQEKFNGLLGKPKSDVSPLPAEASSRLPLEVAAPATVAPVSLPHVVLFDLVDAGRSSTKDVEDEEDLFEDREAGSLPAINFPRELPMITTPRPNVSRLHQFPIESTTAHMFMVNNWNERHGPHKPQYAMIKVPGMTGKSIRKDLPIKPTDTAHSPRPSRNNSGQFSHKPPRNKTGTKPRPTTKAH